MLLLWLCFIFIFLITTLSWLMLWSLADGLWCCSGLSLDFFLHCSLKWSKMLQFLHFFLPNAGQLSFLRSRHGCLPGPFFPQFLHLSWAETLSWTLLTWLLESPPLNIFREVFPVSPQRRRSHQEEYRHRSLRGYIMLQGLSSVLQTVELAHPSPAC